MICGCPIALGDFNHDKQIVSVVCYLSEAQRDSKADAGDITVGF